MGKAALLIVAAISVAGTSLILSLNETDVRARIDQSEYSADLIAREIARSAYNGGVADANRFGTDIDGALNAVGTYTTDGCQAGAPECYRREGVMQDGRFMIEARHTGGNGIEIYAVGYYEHPVPDPENPGQMMMVEKAHVINESQSVDVLEVDPSGEGGLLKIDFIDSNAGYCSAIFIKRTLPGVAEADQPAPEMVYAPGKNRNGSRNVGFETFLAPGTQMNFAIGVDNSCYGGGSRPTHHAQLRMNNAEALLNTPDPEGLDPQYGAKLLKAEMDSYSFREDDWVWVHWALDGEALMDGTTKEAPWGMVEVDPTNNQRWRISFEDIHNWNLAPDHANYDNPNHSLWATKRFGYDTNGDGVGDGWKDNVSLVLTPRFNAEGEEIGYTITEEAGSDGFHDLRNTGSPADYSDQVIMVEVMPPDPA
ncbi:MAG: hypothetical protein Rubg2KO_09800 [Rubricoccaceae bacterium]